MTNNIEFSIVLSTFNAAESLQTFLDSYTAQTLLERELIVMDAGSTDGTLDILRGNGTAIDILVSEQDDGIYDAWNKAIPIATGSWLYFIGADDTFVDTLVLKNVAKYVEAHRTDELIGYGHIDYIDDSGVIYENTGSDWDTALKKLNFEMSIPHPGMFHHRDLFRLHGRFDASFQVAADYDLLLRATRYGSPLYFGPLTIARKARGGVSMNAANAWLTAKEARRAQIKNNCYSLRARAKFFLKLMGKACHSCFGAKTSEWLIDRYRQHILRRPPRFR